MFGTILKATNETSAPITKLPVYTGSLHHNLRFIMTNLYHRIQAAVLQLLVMQTAFRPR